MLYSKALTIITLLTPLTLASIIPIPLESRACAYSCASHCYTKAAVSEAQDAGYKLYSSNNDVNDYPHEYHNYEDFDFPVPGDYYEFPILTSGKTYDGGSPGADRVIFNTDNQLAGVITHSGASGGDFVACTS
ncbi:guanyl-specific ribonuclease [Aspergillus sclerotialis]|uniref:ribonuclease T1 n=1 Tax=Aspergillus sclerotialis TaxID=2070753 RepID=A0A3A2ZEU1_9EURO|nr:guanyl-specific ribonuclease [Aspergillus sclerotialis]